MHNERILHETVEAHLKVMGYNTRAYTALHTRPTHLNAEMYQHPKGAQRIIVACIHDKTADLHEVQRFCSKIAFARENAKADFGILISNKGFSPEASEWCEQNCSFVKLRTFKQLITTSANCRKLLRKLETTLS